MNFMEYWFSKFSFNHIFSSLSRAAQKLNLSSKRKKHQPSLLHPQEPSIYHTNFSGILQVSPPPAPPCLLRAVSKVKENPGMGKVRTDLYQYTQKTQSWSIIIMLVKYNAQQIHTDSAHVSPHNPPTHTSPTQPCTQTYKYSQTPIWRGEFTVATHWSTGSVPSGPVHADVVR